MNYPDELRERYNECMYQERDIIEKFLKDQSDIRYGRQRDTWHFEPAVEVIAHQGSLVQIHDIKLDKDKSVVFYVEAFCEKNAEWECSDFAYGELSKVIKALPSIDEIIKTKMMADIKRIVGENTIVWMTGKRHLICGGYDVLMVSQNGFGSYKVTLRKNNINSDFTLVNLNAKHLTDLRNHLYKDRLQHSPQYKEVMELLASEDNLSVDFDDYGVTFYLKESAAPFTASYIQRTDKGDLTIGGEGLKSQSITLTENDIEPEYLDAIIPLLKKRKWEEILKDDLHEPEFVRKINEAWNSEKYHEKFEPILYAIAMRDYELYETKFHAVPESNEGWAMNNARDILRCLCDNKDLNAILLFLGYED